jgi:outer membrane protein assembly factor BamA
VIRCLLPLALALGLTVPTTASAQELEAAAPAPVEGPIVAVRITGLRRVEEAALLAVVATRAGGRVDARTIQRDVKAIYGSGFVDDVRGCGAHRGGADRLLHR